MIMNIMYSITIGYKMITIESLFDNARLHGNGFLQIDVMPNWRLHVFHPELIPYGQKVRTTMHDHVFDMTSHILFGTLRHKHYKMIVPPEDFGDYDVFSVLYNGNRTVESTLIKDGIGSVDFILLASYEMNAGSVYKFKAGEWHESESDGLTITLIHKSDPKMNRARVAVAVGKSPDNNYKRDSVPKEVINRFCEITSHRIDIMDILNIITKNQQ